MEFDVFFAISQTPVDGHTPTEAEMYRNFFRQVEAADTMDYGVAWIAEAHLSSQTQKQHPNAVVPHWQGEIGLNVDITQVATRIFAQTKRIEVGSAVTSILTNGGPIAAAERVAYFAALHGMNPEEKRRLHVGFAAGRFDFMSRAYGIEPRNDLEQACWPVVKGKVFAEASEIFLRLLRGDELAGDELPHPELRASDFRKPEEWDRACAAAGTTGDVIPLTRRFAFDKLKIIPQDWRRELVQPIVGSHDPTLQEKVNQVLPVQVFNLSITAPDKIEDTHRRMTQAYHSDGGAWKRSYMPRTTFVFVNDEEGLSSDAQSAAAQDEARAALEAYWTALEGTLDPEKVSKAANNALVGNVDDVAQQIRDRFHPEDRLMLWFDFFNHDCDRVIRNMKAFNNKVIPQVTSKSA